MDSHLITSTKFTSFTYIRLSKSLRDGPDAADTAFHTVCAVNAHIRLNNYLLTTYLSYQILFACASKYQSFLLILFHNVRPCCPSSWPYQNFPRRISTVRATASFVSDHFYGRSRSYVPLPNRYFYDFRMRRAISLAVFPEISALCGASLRHTAMYRRRPSFSENPTNHACPSTPLPVFP